MRIVNVGLVILVLSIGVAAVPASAADPPFKVITDQLLVFRQFAGNAQVKIHNGVAPAGVGGADQDTGPQGCCQINIEHMRGALDVMMRETVDLQRGYKRQQTQEGVDKAESLLGDLQELDRRLVAFGKAKSPEEGQAILRSFIRVTTSIETRVADLGRCCPPDTQAGAAPAPRPDAGERSRKR